MKDTYIFPAVFDFADDGISIEFPDLPGCLPCAGSDRERKRSFNAASLRNGTGRRKHSRTVKAEKHYDRKKSSDSSCRRFYAAVP